MLVSVASSSFLRAGYKSLFRPDLPHLRLRIPPVRSVHSPAISLPLRLPIPNLTKRHRPMDATEDPISVFPSSGANENLGVGHEEVPIHWDDPKGKSFKNPWPSFRAPTIWELLKLFRQSFAERPSLSKDLLAQIPVHKPTWGLTEIEAEAGSYAARIKATWLGHACFFVELPSPPRSASSSSESSRGARILFDPVFSDRCSPSQLAGPKRYTKAPCAIEDIPELDAIIISHNHYDHLDTHTITTLMKRSRPPHIFAPLGNAEYFRSLGVPPSHMHTMDWWESRMVEVENASSRSKLTFEVTCTPSQHRTGRGLHDQFKTLWASWAIREIVPAGGRDGVKVYFAGDTGYRAVQDGQNEDEVPTCPAFREIGERFGSFDFAMIPIGAYLPRPFMSSVHCAPQDSVRIFQDIRAKKALGMHWGTWVLTTEEITEPPKRLVEECKKANIPTEDFTICDIGQTVLF